MITSFIKRGVGQSAFPVLTIWVLVSFLLYGMYPSQVPFEKGIEIVRSRGFELNGDQAFKVIVSEDSEVFRVEFKTFIRLYEDIGGNDKGLIIHSDVDLRILFLVEPSQTGADKVYYCTFK